MSEPTNKIVMSFVDNDDVSKEGGDSFPKGAADAKGKKTPRTAPRAPKGGTEPRSIKRESDEEGGDGTPVVSNAAGTVFSAVKAPPDPTTLFDLSSGKKKVSGVGFDEEDDGSLFGGEDTEDSEGTRGESFVSEAVSRPSKNILNPTDDDFKDPDNFVWLGKDHCRVKMTVTIGAESVEIICGKPLKRCPVRHEKRRIEGKEVEKGWYYEIYHGNVSAGMPGTKISDVEHQKLRSIKSEEVVAAAKVVTEMPDSEEDEDLTEDDGENPFGSTIKSYPSGFDTASDYDQVPIMSPDGRPDKTMAKSELKNPGSIPDLVKHAELLDTMSPSSHPFSLGGGPTKHEKGQSEGGPYSRYVPDQKVRSIDRLSNNDSSGSSYESVGLKPPPHAFLSDSEVVCAPSRRGTTGHDVGVETGFSDRNLERRATGATSTFAPGYPKSNPHYAGDDDMEVETKELFVLEDNGIFQPTLVQVPKKKVVVKIEEQDPAQVSSNDATASAKVPTPPPIRDPVPRSTWGLPTRATRPVFEPAPNRPNSVWPAGYSSGLGFSVANEALRQQVAESSGFGFLSMRREDNVPVISVTVDGRSIIPTGPKLIQFLQHLLSLINWLYFPTRTMHRHGPKLCPMSLRQTD
jgi:hypothetical protein